MILPRMCQNVRDDIDGNVQDSANRQLKLALNDADVEWIRAHGLKFSLYLNKAKPGGYYVRVAIKTRSPAI